MKEVGTVKLKWDENGEIVEANFTPNISAHIEGKISLDNVTESVKKISENVMADYFVAMAEIEEEDRLEHPLKTKVECGEKEATITYFED